MWSWKKYQYPIESNHFFYDTLKIGGAKQLSELLTLFEGEVNHLVKDCVVISHYHSGIDYYSAMELTPYEKQIVAEFIEQDQEREMKIRSAMFGMK